jgi:DNA-binding GntR family transcriptional regulator
MNAQPDTVQLEYRTLQEIITEKLRDAILRGELQPGEKLVQDELARHYGVSRMPIREAFRTLEGEGLVTFHPHRGVVVTELSVEEIEEVFSIRVMLEGMAARLAVMNMTEEVAGQLRQLITQSEAAQDEPDRYLDLNSVFHYTFFNAAQRPRLVALIRDLRNTVQPYLRLHLTARGRLQRSLAEHWAIYEACIAGDAEETESLARAHLQESLEALLASLRAKEEKDTK